MGRKKVDVDIGVKNKMASGMKSVKAAMKRFGRSAGRILKGVGLAAVGVGAAIFAMGVKAVKAFSVQEMAEKSLREAMLAQGDAVDEIIPKHKALAAAIQNETGAGDESTIALMAKLRTLGVSNAEMGKAVKLTMALSKVGMREKTAFRAAADAMNGNTTALTTYIPELRQATTQTEKMAVVNNMAARGYAQLTGELDTNAGRWGELKGRIGDVLEKIGKAISGGLNLKDTLKKLSDKILRFGESPAFNAFMVRVKNAATDIRELIKAMTIGTSADRLQAVQSMTRIIKAAFWVAGEKIAAILKKAAPEIGRLIGSAMKETKWGQYWARKGAKSVAKEQVYGQMARESNTPIGAFGLSMLFDKKKKDEYNKRVDEMTDLLMQQAKDGAALGVSTAGLTAAQIELKNAIADVHKKKPLPDPYRNMEIGSSLLIESLRGPEQFGPLRKNAPKGWKPSKSAGPSVSADTNMLSVSDLFTMMQTGAGAKRETELSVLQAISGTLEKIEAKTGGVE